MIITQVELTDFGGHRHLVINMDTSVFGILGINGEGKSTILTALKFFFTGILGRENEKAESFVRDFGAPDGANNGRVAVKFRQSGLEGSGYRQIGKTPKRELLWNGGKHTSDKEFTRVMAELLACDRMALSEAVFLSQGDLDKMLYGKDSDREQLFTRMLLVAHLEKIANILSGKIDNLGKGLADLDVLKDNLEQQFREAEAILAVRQQEMLSLRNWDPSINAYKDYQAKALAQIRAADDHLQLKQAVETAAAGLEAALKSRGFATVEALDLELDSVRTSVGILAERARLFDQIHNLEDITMPALRKQLASLKSDMAVEVSKRDALLPTAGILLDVLDGDIAKAESRERAQVGLREHQLNTNRLSEELERLTSLPHFESDELMAQAQQIVHGHRDLLNLKQMELDLLSELTSHGHTDMKECPLCHSDAPLKVEAAQARIPDVRNTLEALKLRMNELDGVFQVKSTNWNKIKDRTTQLATAQTTLQTQQDLVAAMPQFDRAALQAKHNEVVQAQNDLNLVQARQQVLQQTTASVDAQLSEALQKLMTLTVQAPNLPAGSSYEREAANASAALTTAKDKVAALDGARRTIVAPLQNNLTSVRGQLANAEKHLAATVEAAKAVVFDAGLRTIVDQFKAPDDVLGYMTEQQGKYSEAGGRVAQARDAANEAKRRLREIEERMEADSERRQVINELKALRRVFERDGLPLAYVRRKFDTIARLTQRNLEKIGATFAVFPDPERSISFLFQRTDRPGGSIMTQEKLSGGQKVRLTVAFLLAVQQLVLKTVAFLVLDEPTTHVDDEGVEAMVEMFRQLHTAFGTSESQIIVVDHNPRLTPAFGGFLQLGKKKVEAA